MKKLILLLFIVPIFHMAGHTQTFNYDVNGDGSITVADVTAIYDYLLGLVPVGPTVTEYNVNGVKFNMVEITGGTFIMGSTPEQGADAHTNENPTHQVTLSNFSIGQTEVTQELWIAVMGSNPSHFTGDLQRPVENMTWNACQQFITTLNEMTGKNFRLPTEAEWEFAARGGINSQKYMYAGSNTIDDVAWYLSNSGGVTNKVATKLPNELGLYDMSGNVKEWCYDWYGSYSSNEQTNPTGPTSGTYRVERGGEWNFSADACRVAYRQGMKPNAASASVGLRIAQ